LVATTRSSFGKISPQMVVFPLWMLVFAILAGWIAKEEAAANE
jgi:hypothetical protein